MDHLTGTHFEFRSECLVNITCKFPIKVKLCNQYVEISLNIVLIHIGSGFDIENDSNAK